MKLFEHLMNAPVGIALAFLLVGAPAAPVAELLPSSGDAMATCYVGGSYMDYPVPGVPSGGVGGSHPPALDTDCDGYADERDDCPNEAGPWNGCPYSRTQRCKDTAQFWSEVGFGSGFAAVWMSFMRPVAMGTSTIGWVWGKTMCDRRPPATP